MYRIYYLILITTYNVSYVYSLTNDTVNGIPDLLLKLTSGNDLWLGLLRDCVPPTTNCIQNNIYKYLQHTLDYRNDVQFTSFLKFRRNSIDYSKLTLSETLNETNDSATISDDITPLEEISNSLAENTIKFFTIHDLELLLPEPFFLGTTIKISPKSIEDNGALVKLEIMPKSMKDSIGEGRIFLKRIKKFVSQRLIYALLAILLVIKLLAIKVLFILPTIVGVAAAKKLLLKILLFLFPALHHLFKLCAYVPYGAKHHIHKHQISHIHEINYNHHHPGENHRHKEYTESGPSQVSPDLHFPNIHRNYHAPHEPVNYDRIKIPYFGKKNEVHRKDYDPLTNVISVSSQSQGKRPTKHIESGRPLTPSEIENALFISEKEAELKRKLQVQKQKIHQENLDQGQLSNEVKIELKLNQQAMEFSRDALLPKTNNNNKTQTSQFSQISQEPVALSMSPVPAPVLSKLSAALFDAQHHIRSSDQNRLPSNHNEAPFFKQGIHKASTITFDPFYSPILEKIDTVLEVFSVKKEPCKERLICNMYKNPSQFSPHSNLLSAELSRESKELQKPTSTNAAIIRFYRYVQAARDGQDKRDCFRLYPACEANTE